MRQRQGSPRARPEKPRLSRPGAKPAGVMGKAALSRMHPGRLAVTLSLQDVCIEQPAGVLRCRRQQAAHLRTGGRCRCCPQSAALRPPAAGAPAPRLAPSWAQGWRPGTCTPPSSDKVCDRAGCSAHIGQLLVNCRCCPGFKIRHQQTGDTKQGSLCTARDNVTSCSGLSSIARDTVRCCSGLSSGSRTCWRRRSVARPGCRTTARPAAGASRAPPPARTPGARRRCAAAPPAAAPARGHAPHSCWHQCILCIL